MNQNTINAFFTSASAVLASKANNPLEEELQRAVSDIMEDVMLATLQQDGIDKNLFFMSKDGFCPTTKGYNALFGNNTQVVVKTPNIRKINHDALLENFKTVGKEICFRTDWPAFQKLVQEENTRNGIYDVVECVTNSVINANAGVVTELDKTMV